MPVTWVKPKLVCEIKFSEQTDEGILRHPVFMGLREDKEAKNEKNVEVVDADERPKGRSKKSKDKNEKSKKRETRKLKFRKRKTQNNFYLHLQKKKP